MSSDTKEKLNRLMQRGKEPPTDKDNYTFRLSKQLVEMFYNLYPKGTRSEVIETLLDAHLQELGKGEAPVISISRPARKLEGEE
jgi:hypothetical protein